MMTKFYPVDVSEPAEIRIPVNLSMGIPRALEVWNPETGKVQPVEFQGFRGNPVTHAVYVNKPVIKEELA
jgi:hypothetical protein